MRYVSLIKSRFSFAVAKNMQASLIVGSIDSQSQDYLRVLFIPNLEGVIILC